MSDMTTNEDGHYLAHRRHGYLLASYMKNVVDLIEKAHLEDFNPYEDPQLREGLKETPERVAKAWLDEWGAGYRVNVPDLLKTFEDGASGVDEMVVVRNIPVYSHCEHHLASIFGIATVAYIPDGRIVGLSKINRVVKAFAQRLQVQERLTQQIASAINEHLKPIGVGVQVRARHLCMESRGVFQQGHYTITNALIGAIKDDAKARAEFLAACNGSHP